MEIKLSIKIKGLKKIKKAFKLEDIPKFLAKLGMDTEKEMLKDLLKMCK